MSFLGNIFRKSPEAAGTFAAVDAGGERVYALRFALNPERKVRVTARAEAPISGTIPPIKKSIEMGQLKKAVMSALQHLRHEAEYETVIISLGESFLRGTAFHAVFERRKPQEKLDFAELKNLLEKAEREAREEIGKGLFGSPEGDREPLLLDSQLLDFSLDGYRVDDPIGLGGKEFTINLFNTYAERVCADFIAELRRSCQTRSFRTVSPTYAVYRALRSGHGTESFSAVLIEVGARETHVAVATQGGFLGVKTLGIGGQALTRRIALRLGVDAEEAERLENQYRARTLSSTIAKKIGNILKPDLELWTRGVGLALEDFQSAVELFPSHFFLFGRHTLSPELAAYLEENDACFSVPFLEKRAVTIVEPSTFDGIDQTGMRSTLPAETSVYAMSCFLAQERSRQPDIQRLVRQATYLANNA